LCSLTFFVCTPYHAEVILSWTYAQNSCVRLRRLEVGKIPSLESLSFVIPQLMPMSRRSD